MGKGRGERRGASKQAQGETATTDGVRAGGAKVAAAAAAAAAAGEQATTGREGGSQKGRTVAEIGQGADVRAAGPDVVRESAPNRRRSAPCPVSFFWDVGSSPPSFEQRAERAKQRHSAITSNRSSNNSRKEKIHNNAERKQAATQARKLGVFFFRFVLLAVCQGLNGKELRSVTVNGHTPRQHGCCALSRCRQGQPARCCCCCRACFNSFRTFCIYQAP